MLRKTMHSFIGSRFVAILAPTVASLVAALVEGACHGGVLVAAASMVAEAASTAGGMGGGAIRSGDGRRFRRRRLPSPRRLNGWRSSGRAAPWRLMRSHPVVSSGNFLRGRSSWFPPWSRIWIRALFGVGLGYGYYDDYYGYRDYAMTTPTTTNGDCYVRGSSGAYALTGCVCRAS